MPGILNQRRGTGLLGAGAPMIRQLSVPQGSPPGASVGMGGGMVAGRGNGSAGGQPEPGTDAWAMMYYGPGGLLWRQIAQGLMKGGNKIFDPSMAGKYFTPATRGGLGPQFQKDR